MNPLPVSAESMLDRADRILLEVCNAHRIALSDLRRRCRTQPLVRARLAAIVRLRDEVPCLTWREIATAVGLTDHSSAIHHYNLAKARAKLVLVPANTAPLEFADEVRA